MNEFRTCWCCYSAFSFNGISLSGLFFEIFKFRILANFLDVPHTNFDLLQGVFSPTVNSRNYDDFVLFDQLVCRGFSFGVSSVFYKSLFKLIPLRSLWGFASLIFGFFLSSFFSVIKYKNIKSHFFKLVKFSEQRGKKRRRRSNFLLGGETGRQWRPRVFSASAVLMGDDGYSSTQYTIFPSTFVFFCQIFVAAALW